jgi:hypothetical protein
MPQFSFHTTGADQCLCVTGHTKEDASLILRELKRAGWLLVPGTDAEPSSFIVQRGNEPCDG